MLHYYSENIGMDILREELIYMAKGSKEHKVSSKSNSQNKSEKNITKGKTNSQFNNKNNAKVDD